MEGRNRSTAGREENLGEAARMQNTDPGEGAVRELCDRLKEQIDRCEAEFEEKKSVSFEGTILEAKLDMLRSLHERLKMGAEPEKLLVSLQEMQGELRESMEREEVNPTFDWYDEHYYWEIYCGQNEACQMVAALLDTSLR